MTKKAIAIIQARMESSRLPNKSLLSLSGKPIIAHVIERAKSIQGISTILAVPKTKPNDVLKKIADEYQIEFFQGSETNVLDRYYNAAINYDCDYVMRITGDNPFTDVQFAAATLEMAVKENADICSPENLPLGTAVEVISMTSLKTAHQEADLPYQLEHVSPFIKENPQRFKIIKFNAGLKFSIENLRLTIDTPEDLEFAQIISQNLYKGAPYPVVDIINFLETNSQLLLINSQIKQRSMTHYEKTNAI